MGTAIVAVPPVGDPVWKLSSEKIPHLTILFLGETTPQENQHMAEFLEHMVNTNAINRFGLSVDKRGTLGDEDADVLFFQKSWTKDVQQARSFMLADDTINRLYNSTPQFEGWTPHLTVGYPATPAHDDALEYPINWVHFDKLMLWTEEFGGPEFDLKDKWEEGHDVAMSDLADLGESVVDDLFHYGVKGMKWGVRNDNGHEGEQAKTKVIEKADKKYEQSFQGMKGYIKVHNAVADGVNSRIGELNGRKEFSGDIPDGSAVQKKYFAEYKKVVQAAADDAMKSFGTNASGTKRLRVEAVGEGYETTWQAQLEDINHADGPFFVLVPKFDDMGHIVDQTIGLPELKHYGVKGMRWGVRKADSEGGTMAKRSKVPEPSADKASVNEAAAKIRKGNTDALSNKELQALVQRMNLEQQYRRLSSGDSRLAAGNKKAKQVLDAVDTGKKVYSLTPTPVKSKIGKVLRRGAISAAVLAGRAAARRGR